MSVTDELLAAFEVHSPELIRSAITAGADPKEPIRGEAPILWLVEMYTRSPRFGDCLRVMLEAGAELNDPYLEALLLDDANRLRTVLQSAPDEMERTLNLDCAYTSLRDVSGLHVCAEYNCVACAILLLDAGAVVDVRAGIDGEGIGGQTPLFHTVNSNRNHCRPMMELLVEAGASLDVRLKGLLWGGGCGWETMVFDVTPISYAQCGLYPQFHRLEQAVYDNIDYLYKNRYGRTVRAPNVPNKYVAGDFNLSAARAGQAPT